MTTSLLEFKKITFCSEYCYLFFQEYTGIKLPFCDFEKDKRGYMIDIELLEKCNIESSGSAYMYSIVKKDKILYDLYCEFVKRKLNERYPIGTIFSGSALWTYPRTQKINDNIFIHKETGMFYYQEACDNGFIVPLMSVDYSGVTKFPVKIDESGRLYSRESFMAINIQDISDYQQIDKSILASFFENPVITFLDGDSGEYARLGCSNKIMCVIDHNSHEINGLPIVFNVIAYDEAVSMCNV